MVWWSPSLELVDNNKTGTTILTMATKELQASSTAESPEATKKNKADPPPGYICNLCKEPGHWIYKCSQRGKTTQTAAASSATSTSKNKKRKKNNPHHEYQPGVDPSEQDIEEAKKMQQIKPPPCDCGIPSRVKKVKRSKVAPEKNSSRAIGAYFFFCSKKRDDATKCNFAQPVEELVEKTKKKKAQANFFAKKRKS
jgi:Zinc knuckle